MGYRVGWKVCFVGVLFPFIVGLCAYISGFIYSILLSPSANWSFLPFIRFDFSFTDILSHDKELVAVFLAHVESAWSNVHNAGTLGLCIIYFGLRQGQRWSWFILAYLLLWSAINYSMTAWHLYELTERVVVLPIISKAIFAIGLGVSIDVFRPKIANRHVHAPVLRS